MRHLSNCPLFDSRKGVLIAFGLFLMLLLGAPAQAGTADGPLCFNDSQGHGFLCQPPEPAPGPTKPPEVPPKALKDDRARDPILEIRIFILRLLGIA